MPPVVKQRKKPAIQPAEGTDTQDYVQQEERQGSESADEQSLRGGPRIDQRSPTGEDPEVEHNPSDQNRVVDPLLSVPPDGPVLHAHGSCSHRKPEFFGVVGRRTIRPAENRATSTVDRHTQIQKWVRRSG